jgi:hypothetical protein
MTEVSRLESPARRTRRTPEEAAISLYARVVGLPADHIEAYLPDFRDAYLQEMQAVAEASRRPADFRIGCEVLRHVSFAVEEPELQKRFACLLAAASNAGKRHHAHPAFPGILSALAPEELRMLPALRAAFDPLEITSQGLERLRAHLAIPIVETVRVALDNLLRLGLVRRTAASSLQPHERLSLSALGERLLRAALYCD